jgi:hypothetical protein
VTHALDSSAPQRGKALCAESVESVDDDIGGYLAVQAATDDDESDRDAGTDARGERKLIGERTPEAGI